jgi:spermidine synthase
MGVGTISAYGRPGDSFTYYELNPAMVGIAEDPFTFLADSPAEHETRLGDARLSLENEPAQDYDILVLDAFSSDSIPVHLLTLEAMQVYARHLDPDGVIALHLTNDFLNLIPLAHSLAAASGFGSIAVANSRRPGDPSVSSAWVMMSRRPEVLKGLYDAAEPLRLTGFVAFALPEPNEVERVRAWTDEYSNIFEFMVR